MKTKKIPTLAEKFVVPPFSVLDARQGYWQERKRKWLEVGVASYLGRSGKGELGGLLMKSYSSLPDFYSQKSKVEKKLGKSLSTADFIQNHFVLPNSPLSKGTSIFDPVLCDALITWFCPTGGVVLDPFAGGSVRGLVSAFHGMRYFGIEIRKEQISANNKQVKETSPPVQPIYIQGDGSRAKKFLPGVEADFILTCPPYFDLERYSDNPRDLSSMSWQDF